MPTQTVKNTNDSPIPNGMTKAVASTLPSATSETISFEAEVRFAEAKKSALQILLINSDERGIVEYHDCVMLIRAIPDAYDQETFVTKLRTHRKVRIEGRYTHKVKDGHPQHTLYINQITFLAKPEHYNAMCRESFDKAFKKNNNPSSKEQELEKRVKTWLTSEKWANPHAQPPTSYSGYIPHSETIKHIHVIAGKHTHALADFRENSKIKYSSAEVHEYAVPMEGAESVQKIIKSIQSINNSVPLGSPVHEHIIVIIRGGGNACKLAQFNSITLVNAILDSKVPVCTGVGHERDFHAADLAATYSFSTPAIVASKFYNTTYRNTSSRDTTTQTPQQENKYAQLQTTYNTLERKCSKLQEHSSRLSSENQNLRATISKLEAEKNSLQYGYQRVSHVLAAEQDARQRGSKKTIRITIILVLMSLVALALALALLF